MLLVRATHANGCGLPTRPVPNAVWLPDLHSGVLIATPRHDHKRSSIMVDKFIVDPDSVELALCGALRRDGKFVLVVNENVRSAALQILSALSRREDLGYLPCKGLAVQGADRRWRKVSLPEWVNLIMDEFVITKLEIGNGGRKRLRIISELPRTFAATIQQQRFSRDDAGRSLWDSFRQVSQ
jgi:hypothetical protein